jgi:hypothetical protein
MTIPSYAAVSAKVRSTGVGVAIMAGAGALPAIVMTLVVLAYAGSEVRGVAPFSWGRPRNIAEAAGMGNSAEVLRMLQVGADPAQVLPVRPEIISSAITQVTAYEAAIYSRRVQLVRLLDRQVPISAASRQELACLARDVDVDDIVEFLAPADANGCEPGAARQRIAERSK